MGLLFFVFILFIESFLFFILYTNMANDRIEEVMNSLLARGNTHRDVLEDYFDPSTIKHVSIMESASEFIVVITDETGKVIISSDPVDEEIDGIIKHTHDEIRPANDKIIEDRLYAGEYVATSSPITIKEQPKGYVFMFAETDFVTRTVDQLSKQFMIAGFITVGLTIITIFLLSRLIAEPLLNMKEATEQLSKGDHDVELHTDRKDELGELAIAITKLSKDLKQLKSARNEFLASIAHEIRTPLTYIKGYADIIHRGDLSQEEKGQYIKIIWEEADHLTELIKNLFQLAQMDQHNFTIKRRYVSFYEYLQEVVHRMRPSLTSKNIAIQVHCPKEIIAFIDPERFQQVLVNLIENAKKHSDEGSMITVDVKQKKGHVFMTIADEGEGIPQEDLPYIFDRLYRAEKSRSRGSGGTGLGLAITKEIVEAHGGTIDIKSKVGEGTTVQVSF